MSRNLSQVSLVSSVLIITIVVSLISIGKTEENSSKRLGQGTGKIHAGGGGGGDDGKEPGVVVDNLILMISNQRAGGEEDEENDGGGAHDDEDENKNLELILPQDSPEAKEDDEPRAIYTRKDRFYYCGARSGGNYCRSLCYAMGYPTHVCGRISCYCTF